MVFQKKMSKFHPARSCGFLGNPTLFKHFCQKGFCEQLFHVLRTSATTVAHLPGPSSLSNNTMRDTCARPPREMPKSLKNQWFFNIPVKGAFAGNFRARGELLQRHSRARQGHNPCQIIPCGPHARGRRARCRNPYKNHWFFNKFNIGRQ